MIKKTKAISINVLSVFVILICLCVGMVGSVNAWFTDTHKEGIQIVVDVGDLKLKVYQNSISDANEIFTNETNKDNETDTNANTSAQYVTLSGEIVPDTPVGLTLILANKDAGSASMYVRYKFELYKRGTASDVKIETIITGFTAQSSTQKGFVRNEEDGYYYYKDTAGANTLFEKNKEATLLTSFTVPYSQFVDSNGTMILNGSETIYVKLVVDASISSTFGE